MRLIDADKLMLSLNDNYLANSPTGNETLEIKDYRESMCEGLEIAMATVEGAPTVNGWISVKNKLPPNADHPGAFCPRYQVMTKYGVTEGWYNPDKGCWYTLVWFYLGRKTFDDIDCERGDIPGITDKIEVTHWKEMPEPLKEEEKHDNG